MKHTDNILKWLTIGANIAILIGLLFVIFELRQNNNALKMQSQDAIADGFMQLNLASISDSSVARIWVVGLYEPQKLNDVEAIRFSFYLRGVFNQLQRIYSLYQTGTISELEWSSYAEEAAFMMYSNGGQLYFKDNWVHEGFEKDVMKYWNELPNINFQLGRDSLPQ